MKAISVLVTIGLSVCSFVWGAIIGQSNGYSQIPKKENPEGEPVWLIYSTGEVEPSVIRKIGDGKSAVSLKLISIKWCLVNDDGSIPECTRKETLLLEWRVRK